MTPLSEKPTLTVSWYNLPGNKMANGDVFNSRDKHLAAHKDLPFGTPVKLTNPDNGKTLTVTITDRGPFVKGRDLDVSKAAAEFLGFTRKGVTQLQYEVLPQATS
ncbi:MAG: septal ring lytic transglycosylase RlpA family protein [Candidatus Buchananbacteria bacterium]|nr:septal ring lytic transglycosylase RlpA family protein [Candidatus Buchananbacteria bacterium]